MAKINNFTLEEIQNFWYNATTKREFAEFLGYKSASHVFELQKKFNLPTEDLGKNNPNMKRYMIDPSGSKREDLTGKQFGKWTVIELDWEKTEFDSQHSWWKCQCSCENHTIKSVTMNNLKRGKSQSCGCQTTSIPIENMIGKKFGKLTPYAIDASIHSRRGIYLKCRCDCGNEISCCSVDLRSGTSSCGCINSRGELKIRKILDAMGIKYTQQATFNNLIFPETKALLRFDFYLENEGNKIAIEYQGKQHYEDIEFFQGNLKYVQDRDNFKKEYCKNNNIKLIEIPYWDYDKINKQYMEDKIYGSYN